MPDRFGNRIEYSEHLWITTGIPGDDQECSFMNATLQSVGSDPPLEFSIACHVGVPGSPPSEEALRDYLHDILTTAIRACQERFDDRSVLNFEVQIGPAGSGEE